MTTALKTKTLVLCFDGTTNEFDKDNTNVVKFFSMLRKDIDHEQLCYYQTGIGTYVNPGIITPIMTYVAKLMDKAIAWYLDAHVMGGYKFLMQNYCDGDKICLFGFSRGAYTARALAGMLTRVGLLPKDNFEQVSFAYKMYSRTDKDAETQSSSFKQAFSRHVEIEFLGVWDTVASTGILISRNLPFTTSNTMIRTFRHALSLDERRAKFVPTFYHQTSSTAEGAAGDPQHATPVAGERDTEQHGNTDAVAASGSNAANDNLILAGGTEVAKPKENAKDAGLGTTVREFLKRKASNASSSSSSSGGEGDGTEKIFTGNKLGANYKLETNVKEVWFVGCHSDVGGGNVANTVTSALADIPLRWMIREVIASNCGIQFDNDAMQRANVEIGELQTIIEHIQSGGGRCASDADADGRDVMQDLHDSITKNPMWWILELMPLRFSWQNKAGEWVKTWRFNLGRGRYVQQYLESPVFHDSVRLRIANKDKKYTPKARGFTEGSQIYAT